MLEQMWSAFVEALQRLEKTALKKLEQSRKRLEEEHGTIVVYDKFLSFKKRLKCSETLDEKYAYFFLCRIESLSDGRREERILQATALLDTDYASGVKQISAAMQGSFRVTLVDVENALQRFEP